MIDLSQSWQSCSLLSVIGLNWTCGLELANKLKEVAGDSFYPDERAARGIGSFATNQFLCIWEVVRLDLMLKAVPLS